MKKIILFNNIITPTYTRLFNYIYKYLKNEWVDFKIFFNSATEWNRNRDYKKELDKSLFEYKILNVKSIHNTWNNDNHFFHINYWVLDLLNKEKPDLIIHWWWAWSSAFISNYWCKRNHTRYILRSWSTKYEKSWRRIITKPLVKWLVKNSDWYRSYGTRASEYLISLWADPDKIYKLYNTVDVDFFIKQAEELEPHKISLKKKLWIKNKYTLLFVGQLIKRKWIFELLQWYDMFKKQNPDIDLWLVVVGSGQEENKLKNIVKEQNIDSVYFTGYKQKSEISEYFAIADIFALPSHEEVWWLVINEAMCFGLPIITAHQVWASVDLVKKWKNWFIMKENTNEEFRKWLNFIFDNNLIEKNNSLETIKNFRVEGIVNWLNF